MKATQLLKKQHREVRALFKKVKATDAAGARRQLLDRIAEHLEGHTAIEEELFYPALREVRGRKTKEMLDEAYEEHHVVDLVLAELPNVDPGGDRFEAKMTVLSELVEHHVEEEEKEMFRLAEKLGAKRLNELGQAMASRANGAPAARRHGARAATPPGEGGLLTRAAKAVGLTSS
jgi:hypothetical protein